MNRLKILKKLKSEKNRLSKLIIELEQTIFCPKNARNLTDEDIEYYNHLCTCIAITNKKIDFLKQRKSYLGESIIEKHCNEI